MAARVRELGVWLHGERVATLRAPKVGRITCQYTRDVLDRYEYGVRLLSFSLPVRSGKHDAWAFVTGLLPEGQHRQAMAALAGVSTLDLLGMLNRFGRDVAGALIVSADDPAEHAARDARAVPYDSSELEAVLSELGEHPLGLQPDSELSIAGLQNKILLVKLPDGRWARPAYGYPSTHILKLDNQVHAGLVRAEHACLTLARAAGLEAAESEMLAVGSAECIVVRRFDRTPVTDGQPSRIHQEDACQALGIDPDIARGQGKYEANGGPRLRQIATILDAASPDPRQELLRLLDQATFTVAIGNADAHGKNVTLMHPQPGVLRLAPLYDTVPTMAFALRTGAAMSVGGVTDLPAVTATDIVREATTWGVPERAAGARVRDLLGRLHQTLRAGSVDVDTSALDLIAARVDALLRQ